MKKTLHLLSGGLDSVTMLYQLVQEIGKENVFCVLFDYKQKHSQELTFAKIHCRRLGVLFRTLELPPLGGLNEESWIVKNRNMIFISHAVNIASEIGFEEITVGFNADDESYFPDCRKKFLDSQNEAIKAAGFDVVVKAPYIKKHKWEIGAMAREMGVVFHEIWTCYKGGIKPCGKCPACDKLKQAMK